MGKGKPQNGGWEAKAKAVLARPGSADAATIIGLIHEVNPTGRGRSSTESIERYALKSRLQSLLVLAHGEDLELTTDLTRPGVVSIRHRYAGRDACHALIADLDDEARSWVQREIDLREADGEEEAAPAAGGRRRSGQEPDARAQATEPEGPDELLAAGEAAEAQYDYEGAQGYFTAAVRESSGAVKAALKFLTLCVEVLGADGDALALGETLPRATLASPSIASLLALAAARSGVEDLALAYVDGATDQRAAEALVLLARRAIGLEDDQRALAHIHAADLRVPGAPEVRLVSEEIATLRARLRAPEEARLRELLAANRLKEAQPIAEAILDRFPECDLARRALARLEEERRREEGTRLLTLAHEAALAGEEVVALERAQLALTHPLPAAPREEALRLVAALRGRRQEQESARAVQHVAHLFIGGERGRALADYAELSEDLRGRVRREAPSPLWDWMDEALRARVAGKVRAAVDAVLALDRAQSIASTDLAQAVSLIAGHDRALATVAAATALFDRASAAAKRARQAEAVSFLAQAETALVEGRLRRSRESFDRLQRGDLPEDQVVRAQGLEMRIAAAETQAQRTQAFQRLKSVGAFREAQRLAEEVQAQVEGQEAEGWAAEAGAIANHLVRTYAPLVEVPDEPARLQRDFPSAYADVRFPQVDAAGNLYLVRFEATWLFVRIFNIGSGRVTRTLRVRLEEPLFDPSWWITGESLCVVGCSGVLEFALPSLEIVRRYLVPWDPQRGARRGHYFTLVPGTHTLWCIVEHDDTCYAQLVDLAGELSGKTIRGWYRGIWAVDGAPSPLIVLAKSRPLEDDTEIDVATFFAPTGGVVGEVRIPGQPAVVSNHPSGAGYVIISRTYASYPKPSTFLLEVSDRFQVVASRALTEVADDGWISMNITVAKDEGMMFLRYTTRGKKDELVAFRSNGRDGGAPRPATQVYAVPIPARSVLVHSADSRHAYAVVDGAEGLEVQPLTEAPPAFRDTAPRFAPGSGYGDMVRCAYVRGKDYSMKFYSRLRAIAPENRDATVREMEAQAGDNVQDLLEAWSQIHQVGWIDQAEGLVARCAERFPTEPRFTIARFAVLSSRRAYQDQYDALLKAGPGCFGEARASHYHHVLAVTCAALGDLPGARRYLEQAEGQTGGTCDYGLRMFREVVEPLFEPITPADLAIDAPLARQHLALLRAADERLAAGDYEGVSDLLDRPLVWDILDCQILARVAEAELAIPWTTAAGRFRKAVRLASFAGSLVEDRVDVRHEMLAPGCRYEEARLQELRARALAWIEADHPGPPLPRWLFDD